MIQRGTAYQSISRYTVRDQAKWNAHGKMYREMPWYMKELGVPTTCQAYVFNYLSAHLRPGHICFPDTDGDLRVIEAIIAWVAKRIVERPGERVLFVDYLGKPGFLGVKAVVGWLKEQRVKLFGELGRVVHRRGVRFTRGGGQAYRRFTNGSTVRHIEACRLRDPYTRGTYDTIVHIQPVWTEIRVRLEYGDNTWMYLNRDMALPGDVNVLVEKPGEMRELARKFSKQIVPLVHAHLIPDLAAICMEYLGDEDEDLCDGGRGPQFSAPTLVLAPDLFEEERDRRSRPRWKPSPRVQLVNAIYTSSSVMPAEVHPDGNGMCTHAFPR